MCPCFLIIHSKQAVGGEVGKIGDGLISWYCKKTETQRIHCNLSTCMQILPVCVATCMWLHTRVLAVLKRAVDMFEATLPAHLGQNDSYILVCLCVRVCVCVMPPTQLGWRLRYPQTLPCSPLASLSNLPSYPESPALLLPSSSLSTCRSKEGFAAEASSPC